MILPRLNTPVQLAVHRVFWQFIMTTSRLLHISAVPNCRKIMNRRLGVIVRYFPFPIAIRIYHHWQRVELRSTQLKGYVAILV